MSEAVFDKINKLLTNQNANFKIINHIPVGTSQEVAKVRKTELGQGAKALVCTLKGADISIVNKFYKENVLDTQNSDTKTIKINVLAVLPADCSANLELLAKAFNAKKASLASPTEAQELTDCVFGAIPPFSFNKKLLLAVDESLFYKFKEIAFNAGLLDRSIILNTNDYKRIVNPHIINFVDNKVVS